MSHAIRAAGQPVSRAPLYWAWAFIGLGNVFDMGFEQVQCVNRLPVECSGIDFANLVCAAVSAVILFANWSTLAAAHEAGAGSKWGARAAAASCFVLVGTAFDGIGCRCF